MVVDFQWTKPGKGGAYIRTKMKNMITGLVHEETFGSGEKFDAPNLQYREMQYLYTDGSTYNFLDQKSYEEVAFKKSQLEEVLPFLKEEAIYTALNFEDNPIAVTPPIFMELQVKETPPGVKGDTAQGGGTKPATLDTGLVLQVPLFVNEGDTIKVDTRDHSYVERIDKKK